jgi:hypothetical protein
VSQIECLQAFIKECLVNAKAIEAPDQPPAAELPEGE